MMSGQRNLRASYCERVVHLSCSPGRLVLMWSVTALYSELVVHLTFSPGRLVLMLVQAVRVVTVPGPRSVWSVRLVQDSVTAEMG